MPEISFRILINTLSVIPNLLRGKSRIALAVTEPDAGSDVAGLQTEATISGDGQHLIINGQKKVRISIASKSFWS